MAKNGKLNGRSYRQIARDLQVEHGSQAKYHLDQLIRKRILFRRKDGTYTVAKNKVTDAPATNKVTFKQIPLLGAANCGVATIIADDRVEQFIHVSSRIVPRDGNRWFALRAVGSSMNKAVVESGMTIEDGDFVLVDASAKDPIDGDIIVSIIDDVANIKIFSRDEKTGQITLVSKSEEQEKYPPILIHEDDVGNYLIAGKVKHIIKKPKIYWEK